MSEKERLSIAFDLITANPKALRLQTLLIYFPIRVYSLAQQVRVHKMLIMFSDSIFLSRKWFIFAFHTPPY